MDARGMSQDAMGCCLGFEVGFGKQVQLVLGHLLPTLLSPLVRCFGACCFEIASQSFPSPGNGERVLEPSRNGRGLAATGGRWSFPPAASGAVLAYVTNHLEFLGGRIRDYAAVGTPTRERQRRQQRSPSFSSRRSVFWNHRSFRHQLGHPFRSFPSRPTTR